MVRRCAYMRLETDDEYRARLLAAGVTICTETNDEYHARMTKAGHARKLKWDAFYGGITTRELDRVGSEANFPRRSDQQNLDHAGEAANMPRKMITEVPK